MPWYNFEGPPSPQCPLLNIKIFRWIDYLILNPEIVLAPKELKLEGSSNGIRPTIYVLKGCEMIFMNPRAIKD